MIKHIMVTIVLVIGLSGIAHAGSSYEFTGDGLPHYPNEGYLYFYGSGGTDIYTTNSADSYYIYASGNVRLWKTDPAGAGGGWGRSALSVFNPYYMEELAFAVLSTSSISDSGTYRESFPDVTNSNNIQGSTGLSLPANNNGEVRVLVYIRLNPIISFNVSGDTGCLSNVTLYNNITGTFQISNYTSLDSVNSYSFPVINNETYKLIFSDGHEYEFVVNGDDIIYNYDTCINTWYHFKDSCGNLIPDSEGFYIEKIGSTVHAANNFYTPSGILTISQSPANNIYISANPFSSEIGWFLDPIVNDTTYELINPYISWGLKVIVQNESDGELIEGVMVKVDQSCYCTDGYSARQKLTVNGMSQFGEMSLQDASLFVMKTGYKMLDENTTGYSVFLSGRSNFSSKTWIVKLAPSSSNNSSTFYEVSNKVDIHFRDVNGNLTSKILDTDAHVDLYYQNNNTEKEAMTLRFESSSTHSYFMPERTYTIPHDESGYKRITNGYFTPWDYSYRAVIYNSSIYGWNITIPLTVRNETREEEQHYQNLTTNLWFMYASDGKVDYRDDLKVVIHAQSNNTTLMAVDVELWIDGVYSGCKNLTATDFIGAEVPYYYVWSPSYNYVTGSNYSIRMYGFDRTILETDYVVCVTDNTTRKNKLTIIVKNHYGTNLDNAFVYLEDYGSLPTGTNYYNSYEGLDNGYYRFKAAKSGYIGTGWDDITLSYSDEIVTYVLTAGDTEEGGATQPQKMDDTTLRNLYIPLMALLLILILFGGLKSVL